jgi:hypothetical protein
MQIEFPLGIKPLLYTEQFNLWCQGAPGFNGLKVGPRQLCIHVSGSGSTPYLRIRHLNTHPIRK